MAFTAKKRSYVNNSIKHQTFNYMKNYAFTLFTVIICCCNKREEAPPPNLPLWDGKATVSRDTFRTFLIATNRGIAGDTTGTSIAWIGFQKYIPDTNWLGKPIYKRYIRPGYLTMRYIRKEPLFNASSSVNMPGYTDYKLPDSLSGKMIFHAFSLYSGYRGDTASHTYIYADSNAHVFVQHNQTAPGATSESIAAGYNYGLKSIDTSWFQIQGQDY